MSRDEGLDIYLITLQVEYNVSGNVVVVVVVVGVVVLCLVPIHCF